MPTRKKSKSPKPNKRTGTKRWSKYSPEAAQLFRDSYFKKYVRNPDTGKFDGNTIYWDKSRSYSDLNYNAFYTHIEEIDKCVTAYRTNGTGLGTSEFRQLVNLRKIPPPEDRGEGWTEGESKSEEQGDSNEEDRALSSSDSDDSSYFGAKEEDESLDADPEEEQRSDSD